MIWKNRTKHLGKVDYNEAHLFQPDAPERHIVPVSVGKVEGEGEEAEPFLMPDVDVAKTEAWIKTDTRGHGLRPAGMREPDAFVHAMDGSGDGKGESP